jgi:hypothetical protein
MHLICYLVVSINCNWHFIINMDQMPVSILMNAKHIMLELFVKETIHICTSSEDTKQVTVAVTITADGTILLSALVSKGQPGGCIARTEFTSFPPAHHYHCQPNT